MDKVPTLLASMLLLCTMGWTARATNLPMRRPGLWELSTQVVGGRPRPARQERICLDSATSELLFKVAQTGGKGICSRTELTRRGNQTIADSVCRMGSTNLTAHTVFTVSGDTQYREDTQVRYDPPLFHVTAASHHTTEGRWIGPCPADMQPGDAVTVPNAEMPVAMHMNLKKMLGSQ